MFLLLFFIVITAASVAGFTADSRDGADWRPTTNGHRSPIRR
ncbi:MAG TPA: hypothetical protein VK453_04710 [Micromonosporaceae bacterium]|nr:hypothetical protein [Micromonosporaceae bacterium]